MKNVWTSCIRVDLSRDSRIEGSATMRSSNRCSNCIRYACKMNIKGRNLSGIGRKKLKKLGTIF